MSQLQEEPTDAKCVFGGREGVPPVQVLLNSSEKLLLGHPFPFW